MIFSGHICDSRLQIFMREKILDQSAVLYLYLLNYKLELHVGSAFECHHCTPIYLP